MNNINLIGRISTDLTLKKTKDVSYVKFNLAVPRKLKKDVADFIPCVGFGKTAELIYKYLKKGNRIAVNGQLLTSHYEVEGKKRTVMEVSIETIDFLESRNNTEEKKEDKKEEPKDINPLDEEFPR